MIGCVWMKLFKPKYRITKGSYYGYIVHYRENPFLCWNYVDACLSIEEAYSAIEKEKKRQIKEKELKKFVEYVE